MEDVLYLVNGLLTTKEVWKSLEKAFAQDTKDRVTSSIARLHNYKSDSSSISNDIKQFKVLCDELAAIQNQFLMIKLAGSLSNKAHNT